MRPGVTSASPTATCRVGAAGPSWSAFWTKRRVLEAWHAAHAAGLLPAVLAVLPGPPAELLRRPRTALPDSLPPPSFPRPLPAVMSGVPARHNLFNGTICRPFHRNFRRGEGPPEVQVGLAGRRRSPAWRPMASAAPHGFLTSFKKLVVGMLRTGECQGTMSCRCKAAACHLLQQH